MKALILLFNFIISINSILAAGIGTDDIRGKWYLKSIVIDGVFRSPSEIISPYIYFGYDSTNRFYHVGTFKVIDGNGNFKDFDSFKNYYEILDDTIKFIGPRLVDYNRQEGVSFDLGIELNGAFKFRIDSTSLLLENKKISLYYEKDTSINYGLEKVANSPDFGFDKNLIGSWRLVKMNVPETLVEEVNRSIEIAYEKKHNRRYSHTKRPKKLIKNGKQEVQRFLQNGGWIVNIGNFLENTNSYDTLSYGNFLAYNNGCNSCRGYIKISNDTLKTNNIMCTLVACFPNFTGAFKSHTVFNNATYYFNFDTLIIEANDRTSFFVPSEQTASTKKYNNKNLNKFYQLVDVCIENKELEKNVLSLIQNNEIYFQPFDGIGVNPKDHNCSGRIMKIFLYNDENYYMQEIMWVFQENYADFRDRFNYNCIYVRKEHEINKYILINELLGEKYIIDITGNNLTFQSSNGRNSLYLKSNY